MRILWFTIAIPYIPQIVPGADTQPTFSIIIVLTLVFFHGISFNREQARFIPHRVALVLFTLFFTLLFAVFYNLFFGVSNPSPQRIFAFLQFLVAVFFGSSKLFFIPKQWLRNILILFAIFTIIYFLFGGIIEDFFIRSRYDAGMEALTLTGRGARTLSPEPAILATHILNLLLLYAIFYNIPKFDTLIIIFAVFTLLCSLSAYGFLIALVLVVTHYPRFFIAGASFSILFLSSYMLGPDVARLRLIGILSGIMDEGGEFLLEDKSFMSRVDSFFSYFQSFVNTFPIGDAFTLVNGGGFISLISGIGLIGLLFFTYLLIKPIFLRYSLRMKILLIFWFLLYFFQGSIGVPTVGLIVGVLFNNGHNKKDIDTSRSA